MRRRLFAAAAALVLAAALPAQARAPTPTAVPAPPPAPFASAALAPADADAGTIYAGQRLILAVELFAPGIFAGAPSFDLPDPPGLLLLPPEDHPVLRSEERDGASFTVQRHELSLVAARAGEQVVPPLAVRFAFKRSPLDADAVPASVTTAEVRFTAAVPPGAERLGRIVCARGLTVEEAWRPDPGAPTASARARPGAAFTRTITLRAPEVPGLLFPPFPAREVDGLGVYRKPPEVDDHVDRGSLTGERRDAITYVCRRAGRFTIPAARMTWWDLEARELRTVTLAGRVIEVEAPPGAATTAVASGGGSGGRIAAGLLAIAAVLGAAWLRRAALARALERAVAPLRPVRLEPLNPADPTKAEGRGPRRARE